MSLTPILFDGLVLPAAQAENASTLADQINRTVESVSDWNDLVSMGTVLCQSSLSDFDSWITRSADASDWANVFFIKSHSEHAGFSSGTIDAKVRLALSNMPMFEKYSLPITDIGTDISTSTFWPQNRYPLHGYRYSRELAQDTDRWNAYSGFLGLKNVRDNFGTAFYSANPDTNAAQGMSYGPRWLDAGNLMDAFLILSKEGIEDSLTYAVNEWRWLNSNLWRADHFTYAAAWVGWEFSVMDVLPNVMKLHLNGRSLDNPERVTADLQSRYLSTSWQSPQWSQIGPVAIHHNPGNPERRLDGTLGAWIMNHTFYSIFNPSNQANMRAMLEGNGVTQAWKGLVASDLRQDGGDSYMLTSKLQASDQATAEAALAFLLLGISPQSGNGLAIPLISGFHSDYNAMNSLHFGFDYNGHSIKIPVWGGTELKFMYGTTPVTRYFGGSGIYEITFSSDWNNITGVNYESTLDPNECYLLSVA
jgi:hypothetical protein